MIAHPSSNGLKDFGLRLTACFLILWTPFFFFSGFRNHPVPATSLIYSAVLFAIAALIFALIMGRSQGARRIAVFTLIVCLFLDLQFPWFSGAAAYLGAAVIAGLFWLIRDHLARILATVFATILVANVIIPPTEAYRDRNLVEGQDSSGGYPPVEGMLVHVILDEFAGIQGIPEWIVGGQALRSKIVSFFRSHGFTLHDKAISEYAVSRSSISGILNFESGATPEKNFHGKQPYVLKNNAYFELLRQRHYKINVYQSTYMDYCAEAPVPLATCFTYRYDGTDWVRTAALGDFQKMKVLLGMYFNLPGFFESIWKSYVKLRGHAEKIGVPLPAIMSWDGNVAPMNAMSAFDQFRETLIDSPQGTAHFAHLLLPHGPYIYDRDCNLQGRAFDWLSHRPLHEKANTAAGRELRYPQYFAQIRCTLARLQALFDGLKAADKWADTVIILHGDHGSRLYETAPRTKNRHTLNEQDLKDGFSTLFAVKSANALVNDVNGTTPVSQLLPKAIGARTESGDMDQPPSVYLEGQNDEPWTAIPWQKTP